MWVKLAKIDQKWNFSIFFAKLIFYVKGSKTVWDVFHGLRNVKIAGKRLKIGQFLPHFMNLNHI
jgi:hypothetical protein